MYFDNYLKSNVSNIGQKFDASSVSLFNQQPITNFQHMQSNQRPYFNQRKVENTQLPIANLNKNVQEEFYQTRQMPTYQTGTALGPNSRPQQYQPPNNVSFKNQIPNVNYQRQNNDFMKRRDSIQHNNFLRTNQTHSPSNNKSYMTENGVNNNLRTTMGTDQQRNIVQNQLNNQPPSNNISNISINGFNKQQDYSSLQSNKQQKDFIQQKIGNGYYNPNSYNQINLNQSKLSSKPYASGYKTGLQNIDLDSKKINQPYLKFKDRQKTFDKDFMYNFQLKNITSDLNIYAKNNQSSEEFKFYTPSLSKQSSQKQQTSILNKIELSQVSDLKFNNNFLQRQNNLTDREIYKSPSIDTLFNGTLGKQNLKKKLQNNDNTTNYSNYQGSRINPMNDLKTVSQSYLPEDSNKKTGQHNKNYHALIQNLQKKFSEQKKSSDSFEVKEKHYTNEINKRQQKIKRLQTIIDNNKQTIHAMQETIKQLKKKNEDAKISKEESSIKNINNSAIIDNLKKQNCTLKQEIKKNRKKSISIADQISQKQLAQKQDLKIKQLQKILAQFNKQKQSFNGQIIKLRESNSAIQQNYLNQIKQHQKSKDQLRKLTQKIEQINVSFKEKQQSFDQIKNQQFNTQQKYETTLQKLLTQKDEFQKQKNQLLKNIQIQKSLSLHSKKQIQNIKITVQRSKDEINLKQIKIKTLEVKLAQKQNELKLLSDNINSQILNKQTQQLQLIKQKLRNKDQVNEQLTQQLKNKMQQFQLIIFQKRQLQNKIIKLQNNLKTLSSISNSNETFKNDGSPKKNTDSTQIKTLSSEQSKQILDHKETLLLLDIYHQKYMEIITLFNLNQNTQQTNIDSQTTLLTTMPQQNADQFQINKIQQPSKQFINQYHILITDQIKKILKDMKKLLGVLKQCQTDSQQKSLKLYELDKTLKKQGNKINGLIGQIHLKNLTIIEINNMQVETQIFRLNEKYQILYQVGLGNE